MKKIEELKNWMRSLKLILKSFESSDEEVEDARNGIISTRRSIKGVRRDIKNIKLLEKDEEHLYQMYPAKDGPSRVHDIGYEMDGRKLINIDYTTDGIGAHERTHVAQSLRAGELKFDNGRLENAAYNNSSYNEAKRDKYATMNEVNAYKIQYSYDGKLGFPNGTYILHFKDINPISISKIFYNGAALYPFAERYNQRKNN